MIVTRRGMIMLLAAPAIVRASSLMNIRAVRLSDGCWELELLQAIEHIGRILIEYVDNLERRA